jgi:hypothetical protein
VRIPAGVLRELSDHRGFGVWLDSADLSIHASYVRHIFDAAGLTAAGVFENGTGGGTEPKVQCLSGSGLPPLSARGSIGKTDRQRNV